MLLDRNALTLRLHQRGWQWQTLAKNADISPAHLSHIVAGRHQPRADTIRKLADALECDVTDITIPEGK